MAKQYYQAYKRLFTMKFCVISSFPPKHCGIAEFNQDLMVELLLLLSLASQLVSVAINEGDEFINSYPVDVRFQIRKNYLTDYLKAADFINSIKPDVVLLHPNLVYLWILWQICLRFNSKY